MLCGAGSCAQMIHMLCGHFVERLVVMPYAMLVRAAATYAVFAKENEELLRSLPPPPVALDYYQNEDLYMWVPFLSLAFFPLFRSSPHSTIFLPPDAPDNY